MQLISQTFVVPSLGHLKPRELRLCSTVALLVPLAGLSVFGSTAAGYCFWMGPIAAAGYGGNTALGSSLESTSELKMCVWLFSFFFNSIDYIDFFTNVDLM